ncbi:Choline-sulfatase [Pontiella desulfatans]|uniref:Choline-sulfatase n=1 Tax=Pontiella desulfatans TaxID=2750659 RepID=A0A6C2UBW1_PONDE|nr:sulfatase [Pontiella desulfatans]SPS74080.1 sulfatase S1_7 [Kiritimatiellales bacterium]VGO17429.1 Choline-sulfatase [Pontiella desulfatans]
MKKQIVLLITLSAIAALAAPPPRNVLLLCIDDLRPELKAFGADYVESPNIDRLAELGRPFHRHYVNAPSCGPSRCTLLTGRYGAPGNDALFKRAAQVEKEPASVPPSMPEWFRTHGYTTVSVGKVSHHPGGRGGNDWNDDSKIEIPNAWSRHLMPCGEWETPVGAMHGLAHGEIRKQAGKMDLFQSTAGPDTIYPDGLIAEEGIRQLGELAEAGKPFFLAIGLIKPHLPFGAPAKYMEPYNGVQLPPVPHPEKPQGKTTWHSSGEFMKYNRWGKDPRTDPAFSEEVRRHYAACVTYADKHVGDILAALKATGADKNTIVVVWGDHGWHLGEHAIWGKHSLFEEALHSPLIVYYPGIGHPGAKTDAVVETLDLFPTLCDLTGVEKPTFAQGESLLPQLNDPSAAGHTALAYRADKATLRTDTHRIIVHQKDGFVELYDHTSPEKETLNIAEKQPELVAKLKTLLEAKR